MPLCFLAPLIRRVRARATLIFGLASLFAATRKCSRSTGWLLAGHVCPSECQIIHLFVVQLELAPRNRTYRCAKLELPGAAAAAKLEVSLAIRLEKLFSFSHRFGAAFVGRAGCSQAVRAVMRTRRPAEQIRLPVGVAWKPSKCYLYLVDLLA